MCLVNLINQTSLVYRVRIQTFLYIKTKRVVWLHKFNIKYIKARGGIAGAA